MLTTILLKIFGQFFLNIFSYLILMQILDRTDSGAKKMTSIMNILEGSYSDGGKTKETLNLYNFNALMLLSFFVIASTLCTFHLSFCVKSLIIF